MTGTNAFEGLVRRTMRGALVCIMLSSCAGIQYSDKVQAVDITGTEKRETKSRVLAVADEWRNSGATVKKNVKYKIAAGGSWTAGPICGWTGPDGVGASAICGGAAGTYIGRGSASALIGRVGDAGEVFFIGNSFELSPDKDDILFFRINDTPVWMGDNSGYVDVTTTAVGLSSEQIAQSQPSREPEKPIARSIAELPPLRSDTFAIVVGIDYKGRQEIPNLQYASQDAKRVYDVLTDPRYGGVPKENAVLLLNEKATRSEMIGALRKIKKWDGYVYVYFTGHGAPKTKGDKFTDAFLVPHDVVVTDPEAMEETAIKVSYLQELVDASTAKGVMVALDACFSGGGKSIVPKGGKPLVGMMVASDLMKPKGKGRLVITSSAVNQQSWEDEGELKGGIFSHYMIEGMMGKAGKNVWVKADELAEYISDNVPKAARRLKGIDQTPQILGKGDFSVSRNWARAKVMDIEIARNKLKDAFEKGIITAAQLSKAMDEMKSSKKSKTLEAFLEGKIDEKKFGELY